MISEDVQLCEPVLVCDFAIVVFLVCTRCSVVEDFMCRCAVFVPVLVCSYSQAYILNCLHKCEDTKEKSCQFLEPPI